MPDRPTPEQLAELAREVEKECPIDWGLLRVDERDAYAMMAGQVLEMVSAVPEDRRETVMMATMTSLLVENFALNSQRLGGEHL